MNTTRFGIAGALAAAGMLALAPLARSASHKSHEAAAAPAVPATTLLGSADAWSAYASADQTGRVCYLVGQPHKSESAGVARREATAMVTHRPAENISNVVSFVEGYMLKDGSDVILDIGHRKFELFTKDDSAWARTSELDRTIVDTLLHGTTAVVKGEPQKGRPTIDVYQLAGFGHALALIDKACGVKRVVAAPAKRPVHRRPKHPVHHPGASPHP